MDEIELFRSRKKKARLAGVLYVFLALAALPDMARRALFVMDNAALTGQNILAHALLFKISIVGDIATEIAFLLLGVCLYSLCKDACQNAARVMLSMVVMAVTMTILNTGLEIAALNFFEGNDQAHGMLLLKIYYALMIPASFLYGLWMLPLGYLFWVSSFMPKSLALILMIGSSGYVIHAMYKFFAPGVTQSFVMLSVIAEVATIVWLLAFGVKKMEQSVK